MSQITSAIYDGGVFRPESPVSLPPGTRVTLVVEPFETPEDRATA